MASKKLYCYVDETGFIRDIIEEKPNKDKKLTLVYKKAIKEDILIEV